MMKHFGKTLLTLTLAGSVADMAQAMDNKVLRVYNWSGYIAPGTLEKLIKGTGIKIVYDVYDSNEVLGAKLLAGRFGYDMVIPSNSFLARQTEAGVYQELDKPKLPSWKNLNKDPMHVLGVSGPRNEHVTPYMWGTIGIGYNPDKVKVAFGDNVPVDSRDLVFEPESAQKLKQCGVSFLDLPTEILPAALYHLGYKPGTDSPEKLKVTEGLFPKIRLCAIYFHSPKYISDLASGNICVAIGYFGDVYRAKSRVEEAKNKVIVKYNIPKEGASSFSDMVAIPKDAKNTEGALAFVNFLTKPEVTAEITDVIQLSSGNAAATPLVSETIRSDPSIYPSGKVMKKLCTSLDLLTKTQRVMARSWTKTKSGK